MMAPYVALLGVQTAGAVALYWTGLPLYRQVLADPSSHEAYLWTIVWNILSIILMQIAYWISFYTRPSLPHLKDAVLGHAVLFLARMSFVLPTSVFGFVFVAQKPEFEIPVFQYLVLLLGLFSLYCYVRELERLGRNLITSAP